MTSNEKILDTLEQLPPGTTTEEAMDRLFLLYKVGNGLSQVTNDRTVTQEEAKHRLSKWLT